VLALRVRFRAGGFTVCGAASSRDQAVALALEHDPDFVIMDIRLTGEGDGIDAAREICKHIRTGIIFTTGYAEDEVRNRAMTVEPVSFVVKPFKVAELVAIMNEHMRRQPTVGRG
jgi:DNA-binding response OmpR family regulator